MGKCNGCGRFISAIGAANCAVCSALYHKACVGLPEQGRSPKQWQCPECVSKRPKVGNVNTPVKGVESASSQCDDSISVEESIVENEPYTSQYTELSREMRLFREEMRGLRQEIKDFRAELCEMRSNITAYNKRVDEFDERLTYLENQTKVSFSRCDEIDRLEATVAQLKDEVNERDQDLLRGDIEITNLPEVKGENPHHIVTVVAAKLGVGLTENDIILAERIGRKSDSDSQKEGDTRGRRLVVRLARPSLRDEFLRNARTRRGVTTDGLELGLPATRFYVNERLTHKNKHLFYIVRETAKRLHWKYTWTKYGKIYARQEEGKAVRQIKSEADVKRVFGKD